MDGSSEPDIIRCPRPVIDERPDGIYLYWTEPPPILLNNPIHISDQDLFPDEDDTP